MLDHHVVLDTNSCTSAANFTQIAMVSNTSAGDAAAPQAQPQPLSGSMNPGAD